MSSMLLSQVALRLIAGYSDDDEDSGRTRSDALGDSYFSKRDFPPNTYLNDFPATSSVRLRR